jgi:hypothetical protein
MNRFEELYRLKELEAKASGDQWDSIGESISTSDMVDIDGEGDRYIEIPYDEHDAEFIAAFRNAASWLFKAVVFRPGDAKRIRNLTESMTDKMLMQGKSNKLEWLELIDMLNRLQAACEEMER